MARNKCIIIIIIIIVAVVWKISFHYIKGALYRMWCGVNRLGDIGVKVV